MGSGRVERVATVLVAVVRGAVRRLPGAWKRRLDDRLFGAIFQATRVTHDAYGWPAPPPGGPSGGDGGAP